MSNAIIAAALDLLTRFGLPRAQLNERSALTLLALADIKPGQSFKEASRPLIGITPAMQWIAAHYGIAYAPNTRETVRRQTMHQFVAAGIALYNPDDPARPVNSPKAVYQLSDEARGVVRQYGTPDFDKSLHDFLEIGGSLAHKYARDREMLLVPVTGSDGSTALLSPGAHSELIASIVQVFAPRFAPGSRLLYAGDTGDKRGIYDKDGLAALGLTLDDHGKMPDVILHFVQNNWLILAEAVTSHGPVDGKRHDELAQLFRSSSAGLVFVSAFPDRATMARYLPVIAWETEVWTADAPDHLIHFNGERFLGPYA